MKEIVLNHLNVYKTFSNPQKFLSRNYKITLFSFLFFEMNIIASRGNEF